MRIIRTALVLSTGFSVGAVYTLRHSAEIVDAIEDLKKAVVEAFAEKEDPERLTKLIEYFADKNDWDPIITFEDQSHFTVGDLRALSVHSEEIDELGTGGQYVKVDELSHTTMRALLRARSQIEDVPPDTPIILEGESTGTEQIITVVQLREVLTALNILIINPTEDTEEIVEVDFDLPENQDPDNPKETTTP